MTTSTRFVRRHPADARGTTRIDWLDSRHGLSFGGFIDPARMGVGPLRVVNDDRITGGSGFGLHPHRNMEIVSYVVDGALTHRDSLGHESTVGAGGFQVMSAGSGIRHAEFNASESAGARFLQIWIEPATLDGDPWYRPVAPAPDHAGWRAIVGPEGSGAEIVISQDASLLHARPASGQTLASAADPRRAGWLQVVDGRVSVRLDDDAPVELAEGDALEWRGASAIELEALDDADVIRFDLPSG